jgi:hypothetical protein
LKRLYRICSLAEDGHDQDIPAAYFQTPPAKLDSQSPSTAAIRVGIDLSIDLYITKCSQFQYLALIRFGVMMHKKFADSKHSATEAERRARKAVRLVHDLKDEVNKLTEKTRSLQLVEIEYLKWKKREPEVRHYLKSFAAIAR